MLVYLEAVLNVGISFHIQQRKGVCLAKLDNDDKIIPVRTSMHVDRYIDVYICNIHL